MKVKAFHTSLADFDAFDASFIGSSTGWRGVAAGFFFSLKQGHGSHMADGQEGWIRYEVELDICNPAHANTYDEAISIWGEEDAATARLAAAGHDALILANGDEICVWDTSKINILNKSK